MFKHKRIWLSAAVLGAVAVGAVLLDLASLRPPGSGTRELSRRATEPVESSEPAREDRNWRIESLPELTFDQTLTLLAGEVRKMVVDSSEGRAGERGQERVERIRARLEHLHRKNLEKIARAAPYYESHSPDARKRFAEFRSKYAQRHEAMLGLLARLREGDTVAGEELVDLVKRSGAWRPPRQVPSAENLPSRRLFTRHREPRSTVDEWKPKAQVGQAAPVERRGWLDELLGVRTAHAQEEGEEGETPEDDLGETPEVQFTAASAPQIQQLLDDEGLRGSPAKIVNWVRSHIEFVPIWGALQSSVTCLENRKGTAMDIASLTIALLRATGVRARYQAGTVRMPIDQATNWLGNFEDANAAASLLASGGTPAVVQVGSGGKPLALKFEHVWVRAHVDYVPSLGACHEARDTWLDIDASIKLYEYFDRPDLRPFFPPGSPQSFVDQLVANSAVDPDTGGVVLEEPVTILPSDGEGARDYLVSEAGTRTFREILGYGRVRPTVAPVLPGAPPFEVVARGWERSRLEEVDAFAVEIRLLSNGRPLFDVTLPAAEIGTSRFSVFFVPASEEDRLIVADQLPQDIGGGIPATILVAGVKLLPELRRDGVVFEMGTAVDMGAPLDLVVDYREPVLDTPPIHMHIRAGQQTGLGLDLVEVPSRLLGDVSEEISTILGKIQASDDSWSPGIFQELILSAAVNTWFTQVDLFNSYSVALDCVTHRYPSAGVASVRWHGDSLFGLPLSGRQGSLVMDIPGDVVVLLSLDGDRQRMRDVAISQGLYGSGLEGLVPTEFFHTDQEPAYWLDSTNALLGAAKLGDTLVKVTIDNADLVLAEMTLPAADIEEIRSAIDRGLSVFAHEDALRDAGHCLAGYIILDDATGSGIYRTSGGLCGAEPFNCVLQHNPNSGLEVMGNSWLSGFRDAAAADIRQTIAASEQLGYSPVTILSLIPGFIEFETLHQLERSRDFVDAPIEAGFEAAQVAIALAELEILYELLEEFEGDDSRILTFKMGQLIDEMQEYVRFTAASSGASIDIPEKCFVRR